MDSNKGNGLLIDPASATPPSEIEVQELLPHTFTVSDEISVPVLITDQNLLNLKPYQQCWQVFCKLLSLFLPMGASYTFSFSTVFIGIVAGYLEGGGSDRTAKLGAAALISSLLTLLGSAAIGPIYSISIYSGRKRGRLLQLMKNNNPENADVIAEIKNEISGLPAKGVVMSMGMLSAVMCIMYNSQAFLIMLGQDAELAAIAQSYLRPATALLPFLIMRMCCEQIMFGFEKQKIAMLIGLGNFTIGAFLAVSMGFGYGFLPQLGFPGIAYSFIIESILTCAGFGLYLGHHRDFKEFHFFKIKSGGNIWQKIKEFFSSKNRQQFKELLTIGLPILFTLLNEIIGELLVSLFCGWLGRDEIAARNFGAVFIFFVMIPVISSGQANCHEVSRLTGGGHYQRAHYFARYGLLTTLLIMSPLCLTVAISPEILTGSIASNEGVSEGVLNLAKKVMPIIALGTLSDAARYNQLQVLRAAEDHTIASTISVGSQWLGVLLSYVLGFKTGMGVLGLVLGDALSKAAGAFALSPRWYSKLQPQALAKPKADNSYLKFFSSFSLRKCFKFETQPLLGLGYSQESTR
jgi:multidrug resistance protein, MATE family